MEKLSFQKMPEKGSITLTLRISNRLNNELEELVRLTGTSKNMIINRMIRFGLDHCEIKE